MEHTYVDEKSLKSLEDLSIFLTTGIFSLLTLYNLQARSIQIGILPDDAAERANTILWDLKRVMNLYQEQLDTVFHLLPEDFNVQSTIQKLKQVELKKARSMTRKKK